MSEKSPLRLQPWEQRPLVPERRFVSECVQEAEVARQVGVHRQSVNRWAKQWAQGGRAALKRAPRTGRPPTLSAADRQRLLQGLQRGPEPLGYRTGLWTAWRVAGLIERQCGVKYSTVHAWRLLRAWGWTPQRPVGRALEGNEAAIRKWKRQRWPELKKTPKNEVKPLSSSTNAY